MKWATCNIGAYKPEDCGYYFAWGEISIKQSYTIENSVTFHNKIKNFSGNVQSDAARFNWKGDWRMPTSYELYELMHYCKWIWKKQNGRNGYKIIGKNGNSIFLPTTCRKESNYKKHIKKANYWTSSPVLDDCNYFAIGLYFDNTCQYLDNINFRFEGQCIRAVIEI